MKKLLNTLYITSDDIYLSLDGETVVANYPDDTKKKIPLLTLESIVSFSYRGASPALMGKCAKSGIGLYFYDPRGQFLAAVGKGTEGNVLLRRTQFEYFTEKEHSLCIAKNCIVGKLYNSKYVLLRCTRDHPLQVNVESLKKASETITRYMKSIDSLEDIDALRGVEGNAAAEYFGVFSELILQHKAEFRFNGRSKRPPLDRVNALLSFAYSLLTNDCVSALEGVGLDPYIGFMHVMRPGRKSLALDLVEELRAPYADRFVLTLINNRIISADDFVYQESGAVLLTDNARKTFLSEWQKHKKEELTHPFLNERITWGLIPHIQAQLLARYLRGDLDAYPPFLWK